MLVANQTNIFFHRGNGLPVPSLCEITYQEEIMDYLRDLLGADFNRMHFHILAHNGHEKLDFPVRKLSGEVPNILFYFSDETGKIPYSLTHHFDLIFKAYFPYDRYNNVLPLPTGVNKKIPAEEIIPVNRRSYEIFFAGNLNWRRVRLLDYLQKGSQQKGFENNQKYYEYLRAQLPLTLHATPHCSRACIQFNKGFNKGLSGTEYGKKLADSKIALCPEGYFTTETYRHYEAMRAGCIVVSKPLPDNVLFKNAPIIQINDWQELDRVIPYLLSQPAMMERLHEQTLEWWEKVLSPTAVAEYIYRQIKRL